MCQGRGFDRMTKCDFSNDRNAAGGQYLRCLNFFQGLRKSSIGKHTYGFRKMQRHSVGKHCIKDVMETVRTQVDRFKLRLEHQYQDQP